MSNVSIYQPRTPDELVIGGFYMFGLSDESTFCGILMRTSSIAYYLDCNLDGHEDTGLLRQRVVKIVEKVTLPDIPGCTQPWLCPCGRHYRNIEDTCPDGVTRPGSLA